MAEASLAFDSPTGGGDRAAVPFQSAASRAIIMPLPYMRSTEACYVNKTYVENLGYTLPETLTWDFIWEVSGGGHGEEQRTAPLSGERSATCMIPFIYKSTDNMMIQMLRQQGAGLFHGRPGTCRLFNDTTKELPFARSAEHTKTGAFSTFKHLRLSGQLS
ncbi:MAG: hypothetical protein ACLR2E_01750 [Lachnospiraceae bacterium]